MQEMGRSGNEGALLGNIYMRAKWTDYRCTDTSQKMQVSDILSSFHFLTPKSFETTVANGDGH